MQILLIIKTMYVLVDDNFTYLELVTTIISTKFVHDT